MTPLKPGTLCWLVRLVVPFDWLNNRVVTVTGGPYPCPGCGVETYLLKAEPWLPAFSPNAHRSNLLPFNDPDKPVDENREELDRQREHLAEVVNKNAELRETLERMDRDLARWLAR